MDDVAVIARLLLAAVFLVSGLAKAVGPQDTRRAVQAFRVPRRAVGATALLLPTAELATALLLLNGGGLARVGLSLSAGLLLAFTTVVVLALRRGDAVDCQCFGALTPSSAISRRTVGRNIGLLALVPIAWLSGQALDWSIYGWAGRQTGQVLLLTAVSGLLALIVAGLGVLFRALLQQQGRILLRLDALEAGSGHGPVLAPDFVLDDTDGLTRSLRSLLDSGVPALLVFMTPGCVPCGELLPELELWSAGLRDELRVVAIIRGDEDAGRRKFAGTGLTVLLDPDGAVTQGYHGMTTPAGVLVHPSGEILAGAVAGAGAIRELVRSVAGQHWARVQPPHLRAPVAGEVVRSALEVVDESGHRAPLVDQIERRTLVVMWSPTCSFAAQVAAQLHDTIAHARELDLDVLIVHHGEPRELRELRFAAPARLVASPDGVIGHELGVPGTPVALLLRRDGTLLRDVAEGSIEVAAILDELRTPVPAVG